ncbi:hypothetical protein RBG61_12375 [Paludicola sp. MB14-C6]|uniref:hypothetical protein n=1 Tax=Paludihabitans sp. MB14-C6 TaxID=3070656 RepID=UPI0027DE3ACA|nr:hypothetical protein [Paludicola sp. MB14-C6]WMJ22776.1 hypothetical protein RBG61_12375 [Paludicola sp. MB14-C6]
MKRKLFVIVICILLTGCLIGCSNGRKIMKEVPKKILLTEGGGLPEYIEDFSTLENLVRHADLIVEGKVDTTSYLVYDGDDVFYSKINFSVEKTYLGSNSDKIQFRYSAGYASVDEYEKYLKTYGMLEKFRENFSNEQRQNAFIKAKFSDENFMQSGDHFIMFLRKQSNGTYFPVGISSGAMKIDGEYANQTIDGHEYKVKDVIDYISNVDYKNKEICYDCEQRRKEAIEYYKKKEKP